VVVANQGDAPVVDEFWVAAYVDPHTAPTAVNQLWWDLGDEGIFWGVTADLLPLNPGQTITLTAGDAYYVADYSRIFWPLAAGTPVYAQVDAYNEDTTYGAVRENHEISGGAYNNIGVTQQQIHKQMDAEINAYGYCRPQRSERNHRMTIDVR